MKINPNDPIGVCQDPPYSLGLTKREYFAAMALQGMMALPNERRFVRDRDLNEELWRKHNMLIDAQTAIGYADALIAGLSYQND